MRVTMTQRYNLLEIWQSQKENTVCFLCPELFQLLQKYILIFPNVHTFVKAWSLRICMFLEYIHRGIEYVITHHQYSSENSENLSVILLITRETAVTICYPVFPMERSCIYKLISSANLSSQLCYFQMMEPEGVVTDYFSKG